MFAWVFMRFSLARADEQIYLLFIFSNMRRYFYRLLKGKQHQSGDFQEESESPSYKIEPFSQRFLSVTFWSILTSNPKYASYFKYCSIVVDRPFTQKKWRGFEVWVCFKKADDLSILRIFFLSKALDWR